MATFNSMPPGRSDEQKREDAKRYVDELFPLFPEYNDFILTYLIRDYLKNDFTRQQEFNQCSQEIMDILLGEGYVTKTEGYSIKLTAKGRDARNSGNMTSHLHGLRERLKTIEDKGNLEYQKLQLEIDDLVSKVSDYYTNRWRARWSFIISVLTFIIAVIAIIISTTKGG